MPDISAADFKRMQQERDAAIRELSEMTQRLHKLEQEHFQMQQTHKELMNKAGWKEKPVYVYREDECRPVSAGGICDYCGWEFNTQLRKGREKEGRQPHAIS